MNDKTITWTPEELDQFDELVDMNSSRHQMDRISGRLGMHSFIAKHGKEKCDAMWEVLQQRDALKGNKP